MRSLLHRFLMCFLVLLVAFLFLTRTAHASGGGYIEDQAGVLNVQQVKQAAASFPYEVDIYTTNSFKGGAGQLASLARQQIYTTHSGLVVIEIDTVQRHLAIVGNNRVSLSDQQYQEAVQAFANTFKAQHSYTAATIAALQALSQAASDNGGAFLIACLVIFVILVLVGVLAAFTTRGGGGSRGGGSSSTIIYSSSNGGGSAGGGGAIGNF